MLRLSYRVVGRPCLLLLFVLFAANSAFAQLETANVSGQVVDPSGLRITGAKVRLIDIDRDTTTGTATNSSGLYTFPSVRPGRYRMEVIAAGFKVVNVTGMTVNVQDHLEQNFKLAVGSVSESVTVDGGAPLVDTESAAVSTVVDRQFAENLPMNGRSFQTLIQLTPGVVPAPGNLNDGGQFNVNGQRASANYWMLDGVGANIGVAAYVIPANGLGGSLGSFSAQGGTNSLVSVDALQEFRIQTSTYAPEFGRTPGGQISIITRSGTSQYHGTLFDYLRNDLLDANNWFNGFINNPPLHKAMERQNDFGGTFSGPIFKNKTFFFLSYEGLRLRLPKTALTTVPDRAARQNALPALQPFLNAYPLPNATDNLTTGVAQFNASFSNPATLDAYSLRIDHKPNDRLTLFGRYNYSPSKLVARGAANSEALSQLFTTRITTQTATAGATFLLSSLTTNDLRFNYSRVEGLDNWSLDNFGGAVPLTSPPFPSLYNSRNAEFGFCIFSLSPCEYLVGKASKNVQRQFNIVDNLTVQLGSHSLKFGVDYRRLSPIFSPFLYLQSAAFGDVPSAENGNLLFAFASATRGATFLFQNLGTFVQDTWRVVPRLTLTYGIRWDLDLVPSSTNGPSLPAATGFDLSNLSNLALAPAGTAPFKMTYGNVAPRIGIAYQVSQNQEWGTVLRGGLGTFYDLRDGEFGNLVGQLAYPFAGLNFFSGGNFPLDSTKAAPPPITPANLSLTAFDPHLKLPYTLQWNVALEQGLGTQQTISASYIGAVGRRLIQTAFVTSPNPNLSQAILVSNPGTSDYHALQLQFQRRLSQGLQALASYTWSHSIDTASAGSSALASNAFVPSAASANRGPSDFDIRNTFSAAVTYDIPSPKINALANAIMRGWSVQNVIQAHSAPPVDVFEGNVLFPQFGLFSADIRPDVVPGQSLYIFGPQYPGRKAFNSTPGLVTCADGSQSVGPFCPPPTDSTGHPLRQGSLGRNALRAFGVAQWDFAVHRDFPIHESLKLQFRAEMFNVLNHPNFAPPFGGINSSQTFGVSTQTLDQYLGGNVAFGGFDALYQTGGPRSIQLALKLQF